MREAPHLLLLNHSETRTVSPCLSQYIVKTHGSILIILYVLKVLIDTYLLIYKSFSYNETSFRNCEKERGPFACRFNQRRGCLLVSQIYKTVSHDFRMNYTLLERYLVKLFIGVFFLEIHPLIHIEQDEKASLMRQIILHSNAYAKEYA